MTTATATKTAKKAIGLEWQNNNFARAAHFFCTFLCRCCTTTTSNFVDSRFMENVNARKQFSFSFSELRYSHLELIPEQFPNI